ncbi:YggT family protein [Gayadomonas joobiniege]|uniref:YggT family protein n=1 Tax=Gayadomonas joobiniege TaxID=1234606 RepID=UPI00037E7305|nr:YggT family protein [Gayadomonas joobiniege]
MNSIIFLVEILFGLLLMAVVLRFWLQAARADFYNPISQVIVKVTNPLLKPMQSILPAGQRWNIAALVLAFLVAAAKFLVMFAIVGQAINPAAIAIWAVISVVKEFLNLAFWILIIRAILSWFSQGYNPSEQILAQLTEPFLAPIRRLIPPMGGLDLSVLIAIIAIQFINILLADMFGPL